MGEWTVRKGLHKEEMNGELKSDYLESTAKRGVEKGPGKKEWI